MKQDRIDQEMRGDGHYYSVSETVSDKRWIKRELHILIYIYMSS